MSTKATTGDGKTMSDSGMPPAKDLSPFRPHFGVPIPAGKVQAPTPQPPEPAAPKE